jgi:hypothetical protein
MADKKGARPLTINFTLVFDPSLAALLTARATQERQRQRHSPSKVVAATSEPSRRRSNRKYWPQPQPQPEAAT